MTQALSLDSEAIRDTFRAWNAERDSLDAQLNESFAALSAYQDHLDNWQRQLVREREELQIDRQQLESERSTADKNQAESSAALTSELNGAREKVAALTALLLNRTEELRTLDTRRAEVQTELELSRARERELKLALDEQQRQMEQERQQWAEELRQVREELQRQLDSAAPVHEEPVAATDRPAPVAPPAATQPATKASSVNSQPTAGGARVLPRENPVFGSIVEQFGKLRQQRAVERQASNRPR